MSWALLLFAVTLAGSAPAADPELQGIVETSLGYVDSVQSSPEAPGGSVRSRGVTWVLGPGLVLAFSSASAQHRFGYRHQHDFLFGESTATSSSDRLEYGGFYDLSPRVTLLLDASVVESTRYSSITFAPPGTEVIAPLPLGAGSFLQGGAGETFNFDIAVGWRAWQGGTIVAETPIFGTDGPRTISPGARVGIERYWLVDAVGAEARANYTVVADGVLSDGSPADVQRQLVSVGVGLWRHDWGRYFTSRVEAGVLRLDRLNTGTSFWSPTGRAALAYITELGDAELSYAHTVTTNPVLGQSFLADEVRLRAGVPLTTKGEVFLAGSAGYQRGRLIEDDATLAAHVSTLLVDAALGWQATEALLLGVRYQHIEQRSDTALPGLPLRFVQNGVLLGALWKLPPDAKAPRAYRAPRRVDGADEIRDTAPRAGGRDGGEVR